MRTRFAEMVAGWLAVTLAALIVAAGAVLLTMAAWTSFTAGPEKVPAIYNVGYAAGRDELETRTAADVIDDCYRLRARYAERRAAPDAAWWLGYRAGLCWWLPDRED